MSEWDLELTEDELSIELDYLPGTLLINKILEHKNILPLINPGDVFFMDCKKYPINSCRDEGLNGNFFDIIDDHVRIEYEDTVIYVNELSKDISIYMYRVDDYDEM